MTLITGKNYIVALGNEIRICRFDHIKLNAKGLIQLWFTPSDGLSFCLRQTDLQDDCSINLIES